MCFSGNIFIIGWIEPCVSDKFILFKQATRVVNPIDLESGKITEYVDDYDRRLIYFHFYLPMPLCIFWSPESSTMVYLNI